MKKVIIPIFLAVGMLFNSCSDKLDITPPNNITEEQIQEILNGDDATKIAQVFSSMSNALPPRFKMEFGDFGLDYRVNSLLNFQYMRSVMGNDIVLGTTSYNGFGSEHYKIQGVTVTTAVPTNEAWNYVWLNIAEANKILNYLTPEVLEKSPATKTYRAAALAFRAFNYNFLMENYQNAYLNGGKDKLGVMLYDKFDPHQEQKPRASAVDTYEFIYKDIDESIKLFKERDEELIAAGNDDARLKVKASTTDIDPAVVNFIKARVALCMGRYTDVIEACDAILAEYNTFIPEGSYGGQWTDETKKGMPAEKNAFTADSGNPELILGWPSGQITKKFVWVNPFGTGLGGKSAAYARIDNRLYEQIDDNDFRKGAFLEESYGDYAYPTDKSVVNNIPAYTSIKFAAITGIGGKIDENGGLKDAKTEMVSECYMRMSEVLLMKAEAYAQMGGKDAEAKSVLNQLLAARTKAGATPLTCDTYEAMQGMSALEMVQLQTRIEMWGENGLEFYNNKRWNIAVDRTDSNVHWSKIKSPVSEMTYEIPERELQFNTLVEQN